MTHAVPPSEVEDLHPAEQADIALGLKAVGWRDHPAVKAAAAVAELTDQPQLFTICTAVAAGGLVLGRPRLLDAGLRMTAAFLVATKAKSTVKHRVTRSRPRRVVKDDSYEASASGDEDRGDYQSFPSGHTSGAVAVARALGRVYPSAALPALGAALAAGLVQIPKGGHWPSDVAAGVGIGLASEAVSHAVIRALYALSAAVLPRSGRPRR